VNLAGFAIKSRFGDYQVQFSDSLRACLTQAQCKGGVFFLVDQKVHRLYSKDFATLERPVITWEATEENKTYQALERVFDLLMDAGFKKNSRLVVVGGGILQDVGGFVASTLYRGVGWDLIPTTLLAQADSCIGAKTSVNLTRAKNLIGTFYPPQNVYLTPSVLGTLEPGDVRSGLCEAVKLAMLDAAEHVEWMRPRLRAALDLNGVNEFLHRALLIKKRYIEEDEFDRGVRNLLNYGHTFAHAFEAVTSFAIPHGVAVGLGMEAAVYFSEHLGFVDSKHADNVRGFLDPLVSAAKPGLQSHTAAEFVRVMKSDKKNTSSDITFILSRGYGEMFKHPLPASQAEQILGGYLQDFV
jgi:3-dehydroquinate synthase